MAITIASVDLICPDIAISGGIKGLIWWAALDPREVSGHGLTVPGGPTSDELAAALTLMFSYEKTAALGIASYPAGRDEDKLSLKAAYKLVQGAIAGIKAR